MSRPEHRPPLGARIKQWFHDQAKVQVVAPVVVAAGLLAYVSSVAVAPKSASELWSIVQQTFVPILILTFPYLAARAYVWHQLLLQLGLKVPWRQLLAAFAAGEMTKSIPAGVYSQNYILGRLNHFDQVSATRSVLATTAMLGLETLIALPIVLISGVPDAPWIRWALIGVVAAWIVLLSLVWLLTHYWESKLNPCRHPRLMNVSQIVAEFLEAGAELVAKRTAVTIFPTLIYMLVYVVDLQLILHALGVHNVSFLHVMVVYAVSVLAVVLVPIPTEIGITEITGLSALRAFGVPGSIAALAMLSLRLLATGLTIVVAGALLFLMRDELKQPQSLQQPSGETVTAPQ